MPRWTDNHCHLPDDPSAAAEVVAAARDAGVYRLIDVGCDVASSSATVAAAARHDDVWATAGIHPHDAHTVIDPTTGVVDLSAIERLLDEPKVVAVGECGLDHHYDHSPRDQQRAVFIAQIAVARARDLALVVHTREAWDETFAIFDEYGVPGRTVLHCFTGGPDEARQALERGMYLSFSGIVTYKNAPEVRLAAALCPLDRLLVETDSPFLAPVPHRGRPNVPAHVVVVGAVVADVLQVAPDVVAEATWANAERLYRLS